MSFLYPFQLSERLENECVFLGLFKLSCVCISTSLSVFLHPYATVCDSIRPVMFSVRVYTALCTCLYIHMRICQEKIDYITWGWISAGNNTEILMGGGGFDGPLWGEGSDENVTLEAVGGLVRLDSLGETQNVIWLGGESSASVVWCLRRRIRCSVGDEISSDRWSIYSSEKFEKPSQIDMEADCAVYSFLTFLPTVKKLLQAGTAVKSKMWIN